MQRFLFLYTELAEYFMACVRRLHSRADAEVHIVRWPVNQEAPFEFQAAEGMRLYDRSAYNKKGLEDLVKEIQPDSIFCSGWIDPGYLAIAKAWSGKVPTILILDNQWVGGFRQRLGRLWASWKIRRIFSHVWVPGSPQKKYASRIGYPDEKIMQGFYTADLERFSGLNPRSSFPKRFIYLGRYVEHKGLKDLWQAFQELAEDGAAGDWELWCCGTGALYSERPEHPRISHLGFLQPDELPEIMQQCSVFILPSHFEPWGVVVQEFGISGVPLLLSDAVGAGSAFLEDGTNGFSFPSGNARLLKERMSWFAQMQDEELKSMGDRSHHFALHPSQEDWVERALTIEN